MFCGGASTHGESNSYTVGLLGCNFVFIYEVRICLVRKFVGEAKSP